jgi:excisionase family DNA binding protein
MARTLTKEDIQAIGKEVLSVVENCLKTINTMEATNISDLMNVNDICDKLNVSKQTVYLLIKNEDIQSVKIGKTIYVKISDFNKYIESQYEKKVK